MAKKKVKKSQKWTTRLLKIFSFFSAGVLLIFTYQNCSSSGGALDFGSGGDLTVKFVMGTSYNATPNTDVALMVTVAGGSGTYSNITWNAAPNTCAANTYACTVKYAAVGTQYVTVSATDSKGKSASNTAIINVTTTGTGGTATGSICARSTTSSLCQTGTVSCNIPSTNPAGSSSLHCGVVLEWTSSNLTQGGVFIRETGGHFGGTVSGSGIAPWIDTSTLHFDLKNTATGEVLATVAVNGIAPSSGGGGTSGTPCPSTPTGIFDAAAIDSSCNLMAGGFGWDPGAQQNTKISIIDSGNGAVYCETTVNGSRPDVCTAGNAGFFCVKSNFRNSGNTVSLLARIHNAAGTVTKNLNVVSINVPFNCR